MANASRADPTVQGVAMAPRRAEKGRPPSRNGRPARRPGLAETAARLCRAASRAACSRPCLELRRDDRGAAVAAGRHGPSRSRDPQPLRTTSCRLSYALLWSRDCIAGERSAAAQGVYRRRLRCDACRMEAALGCNASGRGEALTTWPRIAAVYVDRYRTARTGYRRRGTND